MQVVVVYLVISAQFTLEMCVAVRNREKFTKTSYFGCSKSFKIIDLDILKKLVTSACYDKQHVCAYICNHFHGRQANRGKITFLEWAPLFSLLVRDDPLNPVA